MKSCLHNAYGCARHRLTASCITEVQGYNINWATYHFNSFSMETRVSSLTALPLLILTITTTAAELDGAVLIQMLCPGNALTIRNHFTDVFLPCTPSWFEINNQVVIIWDGYSKTSLKSGALEQRGSGARRQATFSTKMPSNWTAFHLFDLNKQELFFSLSKKNNTKNLTLPQGKQIFITS